MIATQQNSSLRQQSALLEVNGNRLKPKRAKISDEGHKSYPCILRDTPVTAADEVWCTDITYIPMPIGHAYLIAVMDWHTRAVLSWEVCNTMDTAFFLRALRQTFSLFFSLNPMPRRESTCALHQPRQGFEYMTTDQ
ncbi:MAG: DDE-type integrase/transposase/recombinase [Rubritalea sp.]|uniref:DDE-type integrase/transposase/recombinase n=1 Tax=Rubritalea sp. TaxID=2109375 RepID=UPI003242C184